MDEPDVVPEALEMRLYGPFAVQLNGLPLPKLRSQKGLRLLAYMAAHYGRPVPRAALAAVLWPENDLSMDKSEKARQNLEKTLSDLRRALGEDRGSAHRLYSPAHGLLQFDLFAADKGDILTFDRAIRRQDTSSLQTAIGLYRGPFLEGWGDGEGEEWIGPLRQDYLKKYVAALDILRHRAMTEGDYEEARGYLRCLLRAGIQEETGWRELIRAWKQRNELAQAHSVYQELSQELRKYHRQLSAATRAEWEQIPQGERIELKRPDRLDNLPYAFTNLIGREEDLTEVKKRLNARLVSLTGSGGVGKTRLAIELANRVRGRYRHGVRFVDLAPITDRILIPSAIASALGVQERSGIALKQALLNDLRTKEILLLLDNCEHLLDACAPLAAELLGACPQLHILATSRQSLGIPGEVEWRVPSLSFPEAPSSDVKALLSYAAVELFAARAREARATFVLTETNASAVVQICRQLDGIPLALELAAAHIKTFSAEEIAVRLNDRFRWLTNGNRRAPPRHLTLRAAIDWSYCLLSIEEQDLLCRLSVFVGGWNMEAAATVCAGEDLPPRQIEPLISALVDHSLVARTGEAESRYRLLETIREYSKDRLTESGEARTWRKQHRDYFLALTEASEAGLKGSRQEKWLFRLEEEHDNLRAALTLCLENDQALENVDLALQEDIAAGLRLAGGLAWFWYTRGHHEEGSAWLAKFLERGLGMPAKERLNAVQWAGNIAYARNDFARSRKYHEEGLAIREMLGMKDALAIAIGHASLAISLAGQGDYAGAWNLFEANLPLFRESDDTRSLALVLTNMGGIAYALDDFAHSKTLHEESLGLFREIGDSANVSLALNNLAGAALMLHEFEYARKLLSECLVHCRNLGIKHRIVHCLTNYVSLATREGKFPLAAEVFGYEKATRERLNHTFSSEALTKYMADVAAVRDALGEERFNALVSLGATREEADLLALLDCG